MSPYCDTWLFSLPWMNTLPHPPWPLGLFLKFQISSQFWRHLLLSLFHQAFFFLSLCFLVQIFTIMFITLYYNYMHICLSVSLWQVPEDIISSPFYAQNWSMWTPDNITGHCRLFEMVTVRIVCTAFDALQILLPKGSIHIRTCFGCGLSKYYTLAEICWNGNEESPGQPCPKYLGPGHNNSPSSQPVLVTF